MGARTQKAKTLAAYLMAGTPAALLLCSTLPGCGYQSLLSPRAHGQQYPIAVMPFTEPSANGVAHALQLLLISGLQRNGVDAENTQSRAFVPRGALVLEGNIVQRVAGAGTSNVAAGVSAYNLSFNATFRLLQPELDSDGATTLVQDQAHADEDYLAGKDAERFDDVLGTEGARDVAETRALEQLAQRIVERLLLHRALDTPLP